MTGVAKRNYLYGTDRWCDVTTVSQNISFIHLIITLNRPSFGDSSEESSHRNCCFVTSHLMTLQEATLGPTHVSPSFGDYCEVTMTVKMKSHGDSLVTDIWRLLWNHHQRCFVTINQCLHFDVTCGFVTKQLSGDFMMKSKWQSHESHKMTSL